MAETGKKMGDYTPLESNKKAYFFGNGEGGVVAVGKTDAGGSKTNRLVKLSDIAGDKLPSGGTEGQVLTKTANGEAWAAVPTELPSGGNVGDVLTQTANGPAWSAPSGGGGAPYTRATASFTDVYMENDQYWQDLNVQNNTYTNVVWDNLDGNAAHLKVKLPSGTDLPMCIIKFDLSTASFYPSFYDIRVYNGTTQLTRIYPLQMLTGEYEMGDKFGPIASYSEAAFLCQGGYMEIHILGDSYTLYNSVGMTGSPGSI